MLRVNATSASGWKCIDSDVGLILLTILSTSSSSELIFSATVNSSGIISSPRMYRTEFVKCDADIICS